MPPKIITAKIYNASHEIADIPGEIHFPKAITDKPKIILRPSNCLGLHVFSECSLTGTEFSSCGESIAKIKVNKLYIDSIKTTDCGSDDQQTIIESSPEFLEITEYSVKKNTPPSDSIQLKLMVTPNDFINQCIINKIPLTLAEIEVTITEPELIPHSTLTCVIPSEEKVLINDLIKEIEYIILLISLASRNHAICLGWEILDSNHRFTYYYGNINLNKNKVPLSIPSIVESYNLNEFLKISKKSLDKYKNKLSISSSIHTSLFAYDGFLERSFLSLFSALEGLILDFRKSHNAESIIPTEDWPHWRDKFQTAIGKINDTEEKYNKLTKEQRRKIYKKLDELNRVSLSDAFEIFCSHYNIPHDDLWPLFGNKEIIGLSEIRNLLAHGTPLPKNIANIILSAKIHLHFLLDRSLLRILNWDIYKSTTSPDFIKSYYSKDLINYLANSKIAKQYILTGQ